MDRYQTALIAHYQIVRGRRQLLAKMACVHIKKGKMGKLCRSATFSKMMNFILLKIEKINAEIQKIIVK